MPVAGKIQVRWVIADRISNAACLIGRSGTARQRAIAGDGADLKHVSLCREKVVMYRLRRMLVVGEVDDAR
jgi:hypothetical protein